MTERDQQIPGPDGDPSQSPFDAIAGLGSAAAGGALDGERMQCVELCPICRTADVLRATAPPELRGQWQAARREALVTMRALIDHYLERLEHEPEPPGPRVEDIPID